MKEANNGSISVATASTTVLKYSIANVQVKENEN
jgi:hypothetical protein